MDKPLYILKNICYSYLGRFPALCGIDLELQAGSKVAIIGANGSGKSTLLAILDALVFPDSGTICMLGDELKERLFDEDAFALSFRKRVGFVFQNPEVQLFCPTVKEDIIFGPLQLGLGKKEITKRLDEIISLFKIAHLLERCPHQLSIGEKKKVAIASVLSIGPQVLLLDEPTAGLDPQTSRDIIDIILTRNEAGNTIITATHDLHIVEEIADIVHVLGKDKRIVRSDNPHQLLSDRQFLQENNLIHIHKHRHEDKTHTHVHEHIRHHP